MTDKIDIPDGMLTMTPTPTPSNLENDLFEGEHNTETLEATDNRIEGGSIDPDIEGIDINNIDMAQPGVLEALVEEIKERARLAVQYKTERDTAKTRTKRIIYDKKLTKNNMIAADLIVALEKIVDERAKTATANNEMIETNDGEFICADQIEFTEE